jgi:hypothetical protein
MRRILMPPWSGVGVRVMPIGEASCKHGTTPFLHSQPDAETACLIGPPPILYIPDAPD